MPRCMLCLETYQRARFYLVLLEFCNKQIVTYISFWTQIKRMIDSGIQLAYSPTHLINNFEAAGINGFLEMYPLQPR